MNPTTFPLDRKLGLHMRAGLLATSVLLGLGVSAGACSVYEGSGELLSAVTAAELVSISGRLQPGGGRLEVSLSPHDDAGNLIGEGLHPELFQFENFELLDPNLEVVPGGVPGTGTHLLSVQAGCVEVLYPQFAGALVSVVDFDSSGSMSGNDPNALGRRAGAAQFFSLVEPGDQVAVVDFGAGSSANLNSSRLLQDFTDDRALLDLSIAELADSGGTPMYASLTDALGLLATRTATGGDLVVLTDGKASDRAQRDDVIAQARARGVSIYAIGLGKNLDFSELRDLAVQTGGGFAEASDPAALSLTFGGIAAGVKIGRVTVHTQVAIPAGLLPGSYTVRGRVVMQDDSNRFEHVVSFTMEYNDSVDQFLVDPCSHVAG